MTLKENLPKNFWLLTFVPSPAGRKGGQAYNEDLLPLGLGERDRARVRVKLKQNIHSCVILRSEATKDLGRGRGG
jgi:hypothetical protein